HISDITFRNVIIDNNGYSKGYSSYDNPATGVMVNNANNITFDSVVVYNSKGNGVTVTNSKQGNKVANITIKNSAIIKSTGYGLARWRTGGPIVWNINYNVIFEHPSGNFAEDAVNGIGNLSIDPLFANPNSGDPAANDFHLKSAYGRYTFTGLVTDSLVSPAIGTGDPDSDNSKSPWGGRIEMGAYGNTAEASKNGSLDIIPPPVVVVPRPNENLDIKITVYPNPYVRGKSGGERINFANLPEEATILIYGLSGELIETIENNSSDQTDWNISAISSGIYLYSINYPQGNQHGKVSIIK
ncbi:MAG: T9SS type A sorting domain-containing protein, partial [Elusimicrobiota bacterium]